MSDLPTFNYDKPSPDTLAGINVEITDLPLDLDKHASVQPSPQSPGQPIPSREDLFGITITLEDQAP